MKNTRFNRPFLAAIFAAGAVSSAAADAIQLDKPLAGASLHEGGVDMVVYFLDRTVHYEVVATYAPQSEPFDPGRLRIDLSDGEDVSFGLPGETGVFYRFTREGATVTVAATVGKSELTAMK